jgi:hypothetical protein
MASRCVRRVLQGRALRPAATVRRWTWGMRRNIADYVLRARGGSVGMDGGYEIATLGVSSTAEVEDIGDVVSLAEDLRWAE